MPLGTRQDFFPRQTDRQTPFRELSQARDCTEPPNRRFRSRGCSLADHPPPPSANKEQCLRICEREISHSRAPAGDLARLAADYFRNRFMLSKSMMPRQLNSRSIPRIALILVLLLQRKIGQCGHAEFHWRHFEIADPKVVDLSSTNLPRHAACETRRSPCRLQGDSKRVDKGFVESGNESPCIDKQASGLSVN